MRAPRLPALACALLAACGSACPGPRIEHREARCEGEAGAEAAPAAPEPAVRAGECETEWLPAGLARELSSAERDEVLALMRAWLAPEPTDAPRIEHRRGILFAKSQYDEGADPPYPSSSAAASTRACGLTATWLRAHLRATFALAATPDLGGVTCDGNVCCVAGMEYVPDRAIVLRRAAESDAPVWIVDAAYEVAEAALADHVVEANRRSVASALERGAGGTCPNEPPGTL